MSNTNHQINVGYLCEKWWRQSFGRDDGSARMAKAKLRRCSSLVEAMTIECVHDLNRSLRDAGHMPTPDQLALIAVALANVTEIGEHKLASLLGRSTNKDGSKVLSKLRFQRLIQIKNRDQLIIPLCRAMAIIRRSPINVSILARDLYYWGDHTQNSWCFQYFGAEVAEP